MVKRKVLLAEDDLDDQAFFYDFLQDREDIVLLPIAPDGVALFEILQQIKTDADLPDLILLDQNMPKRNGLQVLQLLKSSERYAHIPVSIYSTYIDERLMQSGTEMGACKVIAKPITKEGYEEMMNLLFECCAL